MGWISVVVHLFLCLRMKINVANIFHIDIIWYICRRIKGLCGLWSYGLINGLSMAKVIHVHLTGKRKDYYFSSITAVFSVLTAEDVGVSKSYLLHAGLSGNGTIVTKTAVVKQSTLIGSKRLG